VTAKAGARPGDVLLLTKPLGTGVITTAHKRGVASEGELTAAVASMLRLNRVAADAAAAMDVHAATDITGFGLLGHAAELARSGGTGLRVWAGGVPLLPGALVHARAGVAPGGLGRNREFLAAEGYVWLAEGVEEALAQILFDPQTSGGLLLALAPAQAGELRARLVEAGEGCWEIGVVVEGEGIVVE
jgi:selenide,water dikinase